MQKAICEHIVVSMWMLHNVIGTDIDKDTFFLLYNGATNAIKVTEFISDFPNVTSIIPIIIFHHATF